MVPTVDVLRRKGAGHSFSSVGVPVSHDTTSHTSSEKGLTYPRAVGLAGIVLTLVACQATAIATTTPESSQGGNPTLVAPLPTETVQNPAHIEATATPKIEISMPAPIEGLFYGSYGVDSDNQQVITGAINPADFQANNPNSPYSIPSYGNGEVQVNTLYSATNTETPSATMLDQKWLDGYLQAQTDKAGVTTGVLPDGSPVTKQGLFWVDSKGNVLNPLVRNIAGENFGWPMLAVKDNQLFTAVVDGNGKLVGDEQFHPAFQSPSTIAESVGFEQAKDVVRVELSQTGTLKMFDNQGRLMGEVKYIGNAEVAPPIEQLPITLQMTQELAVALTKAGLPTTPEQIIQQGFKIETIQGLDGKNYEVATTLDGYRLMIRVSGETEWEGITLPMSSAVKNIRFGSTTNEGEAFTDPTYISILQNEFQIISPIDPTILDISEVLKDPYYGPFVEGLAQTHDFRLYNLFWHADHRIAGSSQPNLNDPIWEGAPKIGAQSTPEYQTKIREYMQQKAAQILKDNPSVTELGFANEAFSADNSGWFAWEDSPFYRAFGDRWLIEAYMATYNAILDSGKTPGTDVKLFYGDYGFELPGNKSDHVYSEMERLKLEVAQQLNISPTEVPLIIDMQMHVNFDSNVPAGEFSGSQLTEEKLIQNFDKFSNLGEIWIGEMTIKGGTTEQRQDALLKIVRASIRSGHVESIVFWDLLRDGGYWQGGRLLFDVNDGSFTKTLTYFELIKTLLEDAK